MKIDGSTLIETITVDELEFTINRILNLRGVGEEYIKETDGLDFSEILTKRQVAERFKVTTKTIDLWRSYAFIPFGQKIDGRYYFEETEISEILNRRHK